MLFIKERSKKSAIHKKKENQDAFLAMEFEQGGGLVNNRLLVLAVMDGVSQRNGGEAIQIAAAPIRKCMFRMAEGAYEGYKVSDFQNQIKKAFCETCVKLNKPGLPATTISLIVAIDNMLIAFNVGDSPIALIDENGIHLLFEEHTAAGEAVRAGTMTEEEAGGSSLKNQLKHALCADSIPPRIFTTTFNLTGESLLMVGTDGAFAGLTEQDLLDLTQEYPHLKMKKLEENILGTTRELTRDNQTLLLYHLDIT